MKILCVFGKYNYGKSERGISYEYANFLPALRNLGHEIIFFESWDKSIYKDFSELNKKFLNIIEQKKPDIVFCVTMGYEIWLETLTLARSGSHAKFIHWSTDDSWKYDQATRFIAPFFDLCATTYASAMQKALKDGFNHFILTQWAANSATMVAPLAASQCKYQVSFVGSAYGNRIEWVNELAKRGIEVACFGHGWPNGSVSADEIPRIMRESVISLNFGDSGIVLGAGLPGRSRQIKARVFEVPGAGGLLMTEPAEQLDLFYNLNQEIITFENCDDLAVKIKYYLSREHERNAISNAGYTRTRKEHTYEIRFGLIFQKALALQVNRVAQTHSIDMRKYSILEKKHRVSILLKFLKLLIDLPCVLMFGKKRGHRAARRFLYELSWRIFGQKTYSVKGWPGRLFYDHS